MTKRVIDAIALQDTIAAYAFGYLNKVGNMHDGDSCMLNAGGNIGTAAGTCTTGRNEKNAIDPALCY